MEHTKIKYVFRADGERGKEFVEGMINSYKDNPNGNYGAYADKVGIEITEFMNNGISFYCRNSMGRVTDLCMQYYQYTAIVMDEGIVFYNVGSKGEDKSKIQDDFIKYCKEGVIPEWANEDADYIELDDIVL